MSTPVELTAALLAAAGRLLDAWLTEARPPRLAMARSPALRKLSAAERAFLVRLANAAIADQRRLSFLLTGTLDARPPAGGSLALAAAVSSGALSLAAATSLAGKHRLPFAAQGLAAAAERLQTIADPLQRAAVQHSLPDWLLQQLRDEFGSTTEALLAALSAPAPRTLRCNTLRCADRSELATALARLGIPAMPARWAPQGLHVLGTADLFATPLYAAGWFEQQDESSQLAAWLVQPPTRGKVVDLCAGSGGKTLALAAALANRGSLLACDVDDRRLSALRQRAARAAAHNLRTLRIGEREWPAELRAALASADRILLDAPCSGTGSWRRRPEARHLLQANQLAAMAATQRFLLQQAAACLQPGARLIYATCSLLQAENAAPVAELLAADPGLELVRPAELLGTVQASPITDAEGRYLCLRPDQHGTDGFFAAVLRRRRPRSGSGSTT